MKGYIPPSKEKINKGEFEKKVCEVKNKNKNKINLLFSELN